MPCVEESVGLVDMFFKRLVGNDHQRASNRRDAKAAELVRWAMEGSHAHKHGGSTTTPSLAWFERVDKRKAWNLWKQRQRSRQIE